MNEVATRPTTGFGLINREDLAKSLNNAAVSMPSVGGDHAYLKMLSKGRDSGTWVYGQEDTEVEPDSLWALNPTSIKHGYVAWDSNAGGPPVQEVMVPALMRLPSKDSLPVLPMGAPDKKSGKSEQLTYDNQMSIEAVCVSGEDEGVTIEYKQSSVGALKLFGKLVKLITAQVEKGDDIVPIGKWGYSTYPHTNKAYGEIYNPEFEIVEWRTVEDTSAPADKEPAKEEPKRGRAAAPAEASKAEEPADDAEDVAAAYAAEQAAQAEATPRRRQRR